MNQPLNRPFFHVTFFCLLVGNLFWSGCAKPPSTFELEGTWFPTKASRRFLKVTNECEIILEPNGVFRAAVPDYLMKTSDQCSGQVLVGKGKWSSSTKWMQTTAKLNFDEVDGTQTQWGSRLLIVEKNSGIIHLFFWVGEEGADRFEFERAP